VGKDHGSTKPTPQSTDKKETGLGHVKPETQKSDTQEIEKRNSETQATQQSDPPARSTLRAPPLVSQSSPPVHKIGPTISKPNRAPATATYLKIVVLSDGGWNSVTGASDSAAAASAVASTLNPAAAAFSSTTSVAVEDEEFPLLLSDFFHCPTSSVAIMRGAFGRRDGEHTSVRDARSDSDGLPTAAPQKADAGAAPTNATSRPMARGRGGRGETAERTGAAECSRMPDVGEGKRGGERLGRGEVGTGPPQRNDSNGWAKAARTANDARGVARWRFPPRTHHEVAVDGASAGTPKGATLAGGECGLQLSADHRDPRDAPAEGPPAKTMRGRRLASRLARLLRAGSSTNLSSDRFDLAQIRFSRSRVADLIEQPLDGSQADRRGLAPRLVKVALLGLSITLQRGKLSVAEIHLGRVPIL